MHFDILPNHLLNPCCHLHHSRPSVFPFSWLKLRPALCWDGNNLCFASPWPLSWRESGFITPIGWDIVANSGHLWGSIWWWNQTPVPSSPGQKHFPHWKALQRDLWNWLTQDCCPWDLWKSSFVMNLAMKHNCPAKQLVTWLLFPFSISLSLSLVWFYLSWPHLAHIGLRTESQQNSAILTRPDCWLSASEGSFRCPVFHWQCHGTALPLGDDQEKWWKTYEASSSH